MLKVLLVWLAVLAVSFLMLLVDASRDPRGKSMWTGVFMWTLILGGLGMLSMCSGGGKDCEYSRNGAVCMG